MSGPPDRFPDRPLGDAAVLAEIAAFRAADHGYAQGGVINSICSAPLPVARRVHAETLDANMGDPRIFPSLPVVEATVSRMLGDLLGRPEAIGRMTSGGTEANLLAMLAAVEAHGARHGLSRAETTLVVSDGGHFSFDKIARLLGVRLVRVPLDERFRVAPEAVMARLDATTAAVVLTAGSSECGAVDDIAQIAPKVAARAIPVHVDAATGGFLLPFLAAAPAFDFRVPGVTSITLDPHKYGQAAIPAGWLLLGRPEDAERLRMASHYRGTADHLTLLGTRPGAALYSVYATLRALGRRGYQALAHDLMARRDHLAELLRQAGFTLAFAPDLTILGVSLADPAATLDALERRGILASVSRRHGFLRLVIQRHVETRDQERLVAALVAIRQEERRRCAS
jgi:tyrosine decarboxylase MnfA